MEAIGNGASDEKLPGEAMARIAPDAAALSVEELTQVNLDLQQATGTILGVLPEVLSFAIGLSKSYPHSTSRKSISWRTTRWHFALRMQPFKPRPCRRMI
jgi:hypothetical protein